jgi:ABC-2 type transport system ATP-binding protein
VSDSHIALRDVHKRYRVYSRRYRSLKAVVLHRRVGEWEDRWALRGVSLDIKPGTAFGIIGPNGAGKSTTLKLMARILTPDRGIVEVGGRVSALIELGSGFHPDYTGRENVFLNASLLGLSRRETERRFGDIVDFAELEKYIDQPLRTYSSGMALRLGFAIAIHVDAEIMLLDEILAVGDESFQRKCFAHIRQFKAEGGTIVLSSHSMEAIRNVCAEVAWIQDGQVQELGPTADVVDSYLAAVRGEKKPQLTQVARAVGS